MTQPYSLTEQERRVLANGPLSADDYETVRRLRDYGYTDSKCQLSKQRETYDKVIQVIWLGANTAGKLALEKRLSLAEVKNLKEPIGYEKANKNTEHVAPKFFPKSDSAFRTIAISVISAFLAGCIFLLLKEHFGISLK